MTLKTGFVVQGHKYLLLYKIWTIIEVQTDI